MKARWLCLLPVVFSLFDSSTLFAEEPVFEFVEGLRNRRYFDTAEEYLNRVKDDPRVSVAVKQRIPYELAITLIRSIDSIKSAKQKHKQLDRGAAYLEQFVKATPTHPLAGTARSVRGKIFVGKAEVNIIELQRPGGVEKKAALRKQALANIGNARLEFETALPGFEAHFKSFGVFIPADETERRAQRQKAEYIFVMTKINLAKTTYTEAHVYERKDVKFRDVLTKAFKEFEAIHASYRSVGYGLFARMWQGKCFEEQGEIGRALGIYGELLAHQGKSPLMLTIQRDALYFKLICENHDSRKNHQLVEIAATDWWKRNARYQTQPTGLGVKYELARARKILGSVSEELPPKDKVKYLRAAKVDAAFVAKYPGKHQLQGAMLLEQIKRLLGDKSVDPTNFSDAFTAAMVVYSNIKPQLNVYRKAKAAGKLQPELERLKTVLKTEVDETERLHALAQKLFKSGDDVNRLNRSRYYSAYVAYLHNQHFGMQDRVYDGAVLAEFVSRHAKDDNPDQAMNAAYLAMVLYIRAYNQAPEGFRQTEIRWILKTGKFLVKNWPDTKTAAEASLNIGKLYDKRDEPLAAARWFKRVPASAKSFYAQSQIRAGHAYWNQFVTAAMLKPQHSVYLAELRKKTDSGIVEGIANLLNPSWRKRQTLERNRRELLETSAAAKAKAASATPPANDKKSGKTGKKPANKKKAKKAPKKKPTAKSAPAASPEVALLDSQILDLNKQSVAELKTALAGMPSVKPGSFDSFPEAALRKTLLENLNKLDEAELRRRHDSMLTTLSPEKLKAFFNEELEDWKESAAIHLANGMATLAAEMPAKDPLKDDLTDLITAKVSLALYHRTRGDYTRVISLLTGKPHSVIDAIAVKDEATRPQEGITGRPFAGEVYQLLLRAYVGTQNIDAALKSMSALEAAISAEQAENITDIYENLGKELQREIERLRNRDDKNRLDEVRESFKRFLGELFKRKNALKYSTLIWIAETYYSLGEGLGEDADAATYYENAFGAYGRILGEPTLDDARKITVKLRQVHCKRRQQEYSKAIDIAKEILAKKPMLLPAQFEAAYALQQWGKSGEHAKHMEAVNGIEKTKIWGWAGAARKLRDLLNRLDLDEAERANYSQKFLQARYNMSWNRLHYGLSLSSEKTDKKRASILSKALAEIDDFATGFGVIDGKMFKDDVTGKMVDAKKRFNDIFREIQVEMGRAGDQIVTIDWPKPQPKTIEPVAAKQKANGSGSKTVAASKTGDADKNAEEAAGTSWLVVIFGVVLALVLFAGGGWFLFNMSKQQKNRRNLYAGISSSTFIPPQGVQPNRAAGTQQVRTTKGNTGGRKQSQQRAASGTQRKAKDAAPPSNPPKKPSK